MNKIIKSFTQFINEEYQYDELENEYDDIDNLDNDTEESDDELDDDLDKVNEISDELVNKTSDKMQSYGQDSRSSRLLNNQYKIKEMFPAYEKFGKNEDDRDFVIARTNISYKGTIRCYIQLCNPNGDYIPLEYEPSDDVFKFNGKIVTTNTTYIIFNRENDGNPNVIHRRLTDPLLDKPSQKL